MTHLNRIFFVIFSLCFFGCSTTVGTLGCSFSSTINEWTKVDDCVIPNSMGFSIVSLGVVSQLEFDPGNELAQVLLADGWAYVDRNGTIVIRGVQAFDNGAEPFKDGLVRVLIEGKYGFANPKGAITIPAQFDGAYAFEGGHTAVCTGCTLEEIGEYHELVGGKWSCIDTKGKIVEDTLCESRSEL